MAYRAVRGAPAAAPGQRGLGAPAAKRQRTASEVQPDEADAETDQLDLLDACRLQEDPAAQYVVTKVGDPGEVRALLASSWKPQSVAAANRSQAEQLHDALLRERESRMVSGGAVDHIVAFQHEHGLSNDDILALRELAHKDLQYVLSEYGDGRQLDELVQEASMQEAPEYPETAAAAAPDAPGVLAMGRIMRLELIDPSAEAVVIGDANLTFSHLLMRHRKALGHSGGTLATTFEEIDTLRERYPEIDSTVQKMRDLDGDVLHGVDGTRLTVDSRFEGREGTFGAVYYNFPHAGVVQGFYDGHPFVRWRHENLMFLFFRQLTRFMKPQGIVKVASNRSAKGVRFSDILRAAKTQGFVHIATIPFLEWALRDYRRSYGDRRDAKRRPEDGDNYRAQNAEADMVYCFEYRPSSGELGAPQIRFPPTKSQLLHSNEGKLGSQGSAAKERSVDDIYKLFLSYVSGIHVG